MLVRGLSTSKFIEVKNSFSTITKWLFLQQICSRVQEDEHPKLEDHNIICKAQPTQHKKNIHLYFFFNIIMTLFLLAVTVYLILDYFKIKNYRYTVGYDKLIIAMQTIFPILIIFIILKVLLIPYTYSKNIRSTLFNEGIIKYIHKEDNISIERGKIQDLNDNWIELLVKKRNEKKIIIIPKNAIKLVEKNPDNSLAKITIINQEDKLVRTHGFILSKNKDEIVIFSKENQMLWIIPTSRAFITIIERENDVLEYNIKKHLSLKSDSPI
jgi:hypothetical protein